MNFLKGFFSYNVNWGLPKIGHFSVQSQFLGPKINLIFLELFFLSDHQNSGTTCINTTLSFSNIFILPIFYGDHSNRFSSIKKPFECIHWDV